MFDLFSNTKRGQSNPHLAPKSNQISWIPDRMSQTAYITEEVQPGKGGRLHYLSTEWGAISADGSPIPKNTIVRPIMRQGNAWIVIAEPHNLPHSTQVA